MKSESEPTSTRFAAVYGSPGQGPRTLGPLRVFWPLILICFVAGWLLRTALPSPKISTSLTGFLFLALAVVLTLFMAWSARRLRSFLKGAEGEEKVARSLSFLPASHTVFNDLQLRDDGPSFDHVVVTPTGLFVIETKNWSGDITFENGQIFCNGKTPHRSPLKQVKEASAALLNHLSDAHCPEAPVLPVVCFVNNQPQGGLTNVGGVRVCTDADLHELFENRLETPLPAGIPGIIVSELKRCIEEK